MQLCDVYFVAVHKGAVLGAQVPNGEDILLASDLAVVTADPAIVEMDMAADASSHADGKSAQHNFTGRGVASCRDQFRKRGGHDSRVVEGAGRGSRR